MAKDAAPMGGLFEADCSTLVLNSVDFVERNARINETTENSLSQCASRSRHGSGTQVY
jgi:hypothetical protein